MLDSLRKHATGWVAKVLFAILILSFAVWGIGDVFLGSRGGDTVAEVAGTDVTTRELTNEFENRWRELQEQFGSNVDRRTAVSLGLVSQALDGVIARRLVDAHGRDLALATADETVARLIREDPSFQGLGGFERERFDLFLRSIGMSEEAYVDLLRAEIVRNRLVGSITAPLAVPKTLAQTLYDHRNEARRGQVLLVRADAMPVDTPGEETLAAHLKENARQYETPETRSVTLLVLRPDDLLDEIELSEAELQAAYDSRIAQYRTPEQRRLEQLLALDEATIRQAAELVAAGQSFTAVANALKARSVERTELGPLARGDLPEELDERAWSLSEGGTSEPLQSPFGWHLLRITDVEPEKVQPLAAVKDQLRRELTLERATERLPDLATQLDDEIAAGTPLDAAGEKLGLDVLKLERFDRTGHTPQKERLLADRLTSDILQAIFAAGAGETSLLQQADDGSYYMFRVDAVEPARERPLAEVRQEVEAAWRDAEQRRRARERAEALRGQATSPAALAELAGRESGVELLSVGPVIRSDSGALQGLNQAAVEALFAAEPGRVADHVVDVPGGTVVVATEEIVPATANEPLLDGVEAGILNTMRTELLRDYEAALRQRYTVSIDQSAVARLMEAQAQ